MATEEAVLRSSTSDQPAVADDEPDNPFQENGELRRKADFIVTHSRISRTEVQIADPDSMPADSTDETVPILLHVNGSVPPPSGDDEADADRSNVVEDVDGSPRVEAVIDAEPAGSPTSAAAEKVKLKKRKRCVVQ